MALTNDDGVVAGSLMEKLTAILERLVENQPIRKITFSRFDPKTPFHKSKKDMHRLEREWYQNGFPMRAESMFNAEIDALNQLTRPGRYVNRLIEVIARDHGPDVVMELRYKNKDIDDRLAHRSAYRNLTDMLQQAVAEQNAILDKEAEDAAALAELKAQQRAKKAAEVKAPKSKTAKAADEALDDLSNLSIDRP